MSRLRGARALAFAYLLETWRAKPAIFWNLVFPLLSLVLFAFVFGGGEPAGVARVLPGIMTINLLAAAFFGVSLHMVNLREKHLYRRFSVTPVSGLAVVVAHAVTALFNILISVVLQLAAAKTFFGVAIRSSLGELGLAILIGAFAFIPLGLLVGSVGKDMRSAPAISNLLFFPLTFLSGATMPLYLMPPWIRKIATLLPSTYLVELLQAAVNAPDPFDRAATAAGILVLTGVVGFAVNGLVFRWESTQPLNRRGLAVSLASLALIYGAAYLQDVRLESAQRPDRAAQGTPAQSGAGTHVLRGMTVIDGTGRRIERAQITIAEKRIANVGPIGEVPDGAPVTDLSGAYVIPGLIDSHIHLGGSAGGSTSPEEYVPSRLVHDLQAYLALGVTAFVSLSDHVEDMQKLRDQIAAGTMRAPHVYLSGPGITAPGGHPARLFSFLPGFGEYMTRQVSTPEAAREAVRELVGMRVSVVKLFLEADAAGQGLPVLPEPALRAAIRAAHDAGLKTTVHVDSDAHARLAIDAGADGIEHVPPDLSDSTIQAFVARQVPLTPTLAVFESLARLMTDGPVDEPLARDWVVPVVLESLTANASWIAKVRSSKTRAASYVRRFEQSRVSLRRAVAGGVTILAGSDAGNAGVFHGPGLIREIELMVAEGGMSPRAALVAATGTAARRLGTNDVGSIAPGAFADLVVLDRDPEQDIRALRGVRAVYFSGRLLNRDTLLSTNPGNWNPTFSFPAPNMPRGSD